MTYPLPADAVLASHDATRFIAEHGYIYRDDERVSHTLKCPICSEPWLDPVQADPCGHIFCSLCINTWTSSQPTCPVDRTRLTPPNSVKRPAQILCELVDELQVLCSLGCGWSGRRDGWKSHLERECEEVEVDGRRRRSLASKGKAKETDDADMADADEEGDAEEEQEMTPPPDADADAGVEGGSGISQQTLGGAEKRAIKQRERELLRRIAALKGEAKQSTGTIEAWKGKVIKLEGQLADALKAEATLHEPESPTVRGASRKGAKRGAVGLEGWGSSSGGGWDEKPKDHPARCDRCRETIRGVRHKCFKCPDFDLCDECVPLAPTFHPGHDFAPLRSPSDVEVRSLPEWKTSHAGVTCDWCFKALVGPRFRCTVCHNFDLCHKCVALPTQPHNKDHPMVRYLVPDSSSTRRPIYV